MLIPDYLGDGYCAFPTTTVKRWSIPNQEPMIEQLFSLKQVATLQAKIDALMLEHCPDEMTKEQLDRWASHQTPAEDLHCESIIKSL